MIRNLKALGLSLLVLFTMGALGASSASAVTTDKITTGVSPAILTGVSHDHVLTLTNASGEAIIKFECTTAKFAATVRNGDSEITAEPVYEGRNETPHANPDCNSSNGEGLIDTTGCAYIINGETKNAHGGGNDAPLWIECESTGGVPHKIKFTDTDTGITISIPAQTPTHGGVIFTNVANHPKAGDPSAVKVTATVTGITFTCAPTFFCTLAGIPHHGNNTDYNGTLTMTAYKDIEGLPTPVTEGARVSLAVSS